MSEDRTDAWSRAELWGRVQELEAQVAQLTQERDAWHGKWLRTSQKADDEIDALRAKVERYEAALREIAGNADYDETHEVVRLVNRQNLARAALTQPQEASDPAPAVCFCNQGGTVKGTVEHPRPVHRHQEASDA